MEEYSKDLNCVEFFDAEGEKRLYLQMHQGDEEARRKLIESVLPWALVIVKRITSRRRLGNLELGDLVSVANKTIVTLVDNSFDPAKGRLSTYIVRNVKWEVERYICENRSVIRVPQGAYKDPKKWGPTSERIINEGVYKFPERWDAVAKEIDPETVADINTMLFEITQLPWRLREVLRRRLQGHTLQQIGNDFQISRERVRQIQLRAIKLLKEKLDS